MFEWFRAHPTFTGWLFALSAVMFLGGLILMPWMLSRMRADHFLQPQAPPDAWGGRHPALRLSVLVFKNLVGVVLVLAGAAMLVLPGQGIITILAGLSLLNLPGKRRLELFIVRQRPVLQAINWIRARGARAPLLLPEKD
jgi:hypothetical protein